MDVFERDGGTTTADTVHKREEFRQIVADVQELPETQRTALLLREIDALSYDQIAEAMDTTVPSVKSLLVRARVSLAEAAEARLLTCDEVRLELGQVAEGLTQDDRPGPPPPEALRALPHLPRPSCARQTARSRPSTRSARSWSSRSSSSRSSARAPRAAASPRAQCGRGRRRRRRIRDDDGRRHCRRGHRNRGGRGGTAAAVGSTPRSAERPRPAPQPPAERPRAARCPPASVPSARRQSPAWPPPRSSPQAPSR